MDDVEHDIRPVVARGKPNNLGLWIFLAILLIGGLWLFLVLSANRAELEAPVTAARPSDGAGRIAAAPPLAVPPTFGERPARLAAAPVQVREAQPAPRPIEQPAAASPRARAVQPAPIIPPVVTPVPTRPSVVFDGAFAPPASSPAAPSDSSAERVTAGRFANPSRTIPKGTVIPAVLETALDSTRPGAARALVQRNIYGFDGTRILIQRGSRIYGEYESGLEAGQNRTMITWTRLIRPDGVTIELDSPSSDPLGRAGVRGRVDGKFLQRFGGAILQSVLDIGVGLATREVAGDGVFVALPGSTQNLQVQQRERVQRTLKIRHGTSVSVFVARDLDFSTVEF